MDNLTDLQQILEYNFSNIELLKTGLTHSSTSTNNNYERLEFLGDRVLGLAIASIIFETFPKENEGNLAKRHAVLVQGKTLAEIAKSINLGDFMILSDAEIVAGGKDNENILADVMEGVLGAIYIDSGLDTCQRIISKMWGDRIKHMVKPPQEPKTALQEWAQGRGLPLPEYELINQEGPDHAPVFDVKVTIQGHSPVISKGATSLRKAEKLAASSLLEKLNNTEPGKQ